jgi:hypothetical protein
MNITVGSGKTRRTVTVPSVAAARQSQEMKIEREKAGDAIKSFLFRPNLLKRKG